MMSIEDFGEIPGVEITVLVDNRADIIVKSTKTVKRFTQEPLLAEHGFAALVDLKTSGAPAPECVRILWDAGMTSIALPENARRMEIDLSTVDKIALSHGHLDHYAAITEVLKEVAPPPAPREWSKETTVAEMRDWARGRRVPLIAHPAAFRERWGVDRDGKKYGPRVAPRAEWEAAGADIVLSAGPHKLGPGCWTTGAVPRRSFEQAGTPPSAAFREGDLLVRDYIDDDQSIVINVKDKGLVILTGCAHAGVVNTANYAREISGIDRVWAILGGFHLAPAKDKIIQRTIDEIKKLDPVMVVPSHCTGFEAIRQFAAQMPDQFVLGTVGARYLF